MIHNPQLNEKFLPIVQGALGEHYEDASYVNDATDSIYSEQDDIQIYLPNAKVADPTDHESFDTFSVILNVQEIHGDAIYSEPFKTLEEAIVFITNNTIF